MSRDIIHAQIHDIVEWDYYSSISRQDPFNDIKLYVIVSLEEEEWEVPTFWRGEQKWSIRFTPPKAGKYTVVSVCSDITDVFLHNTTLSLDVTERLDESLFPTPNHLAIHNNKYIIDYNTQKPFFWLADTWWMGLSSRLTWPDGFQTLVKDRKDKGFTVVLLVAGFFPDMDIFDERGKNEAGFPWEEDFSKINPEFFDKADDRIKCLLEAGITPCILGSWGYYLSKMEESTMMKHWQYIISRWSAYPVVWSVAGEATMPYYLSENRTFDEEKQKEGWTNITKYINEIDPFNRLVTIHPTEVGRDQIHDESLIDFNFLQTGHSGYESVSNTVRLIKQEKLRQPPIPIIIGEVNYEGIMHDTGAEIQRLTFWTAMLSGAVGFTYGANGIWQVNTKDKPFGKSPHGGNWGNMPWEEAILLEGSKHIALAKKLLLRFEWWKLEVHPEWISPQGNPENIKTPRLAGIKEELRLIYFYGPIHPWAEPKYKLLSLEPDIQYKAFFWDPRTGEEISLGIVLTDIKGEWYIPNLPTFDDWLLVLDSVQSSNTYTKKLPLFSQYLEKISKNFLVKTFS